MGTTVASIVIVSCYDVEKIELIIQHIGANCYVDNLPCIAVASLPESSSGLYGFDSNEEQDVGHEFKRPVVLTRELAR